MGFNLKRSLRIQRDAANALRDLFSRAKSFGFTHNQMLNQRGGIYAKLRVNDCPAWVNSYLQGVWDTLQAQAYQHDLVYGGYVDGLFYSTHSDREDYYQKHGIEPRDYADNGRVKSRGHYWKDNLNPFFGDDNA